MKTLSCAIGAIALVFVSVMFGATATATASGPTSGASDARLAAAAGDEEGEESLGKLMLVLDSSGSMAEAAGGGGGSKIDAAKTALDDVITALPGDAEVGLRVFGATVFSRSNPASCEDSQRVVDIGTDNRSELKSAVSSYKPFGETPIPYALREAASDLGNEGARSIVLVSDGESTCTPDPCDVAGELSKQGIDLQINVVGLSVSGEAREQLQCIAESGNGTYYDADNAADIESQLTRVAERSLRPFVLNGGELAGGSEEAPTPVGVGTYRDTLDADGAEGGTKSFVFTRELEDTTLRVSAITQGEPGDDGLMVQIFGPDGTRCDYRNDLRQLVDSRDVIGAMATASSDTNCGEPGDYRITVERSLGNDQEVSYGLRVTEEPPVEDPGFTSDAAADPSPIDASGNAEEVVGGASFANSAPIGPGSYSSTVVPGEASLYAIPLDFGQSARVSVSFPEPNAATRDVVGLFPPLSKITLYNPMQAIIAPPSGSAATGQVGQDSATLTSATPPISRSRESRIEGDYTMSGDYYLAVSLERADFSAELPYTITVEVDGEPQDGPTYVDGATWSVADGAVYPEDVDGPTAEPGAESTDSENTEPQSAAGDDGGSSAADTIGIVAGVVGVGALATAAVMWRRLRRA